LHPKVLSKNAWEIVRRLTGSGILEGWTLAGGTGLALQFGHRYSEDLDLFRPEVFDPEALVNELAGFGKVEIQHRASGTLHTVIQGVRLSFLEAQAEFLFPGLPYRGLTVADPLDIAVMKLIAVGGRGSRKDFVDLFFLFRQGVSLESMFKMLRRRFREIDYNEYHLMKSMVYFEDAESEPMPDMIRKISWEEIKAAIVLEVRRLA